MPQTPKTRTSALLLAAAVLLAACAKDPPPPLQTSGGRALLLGPEPGFNAAQLADPWWRTTDRGAAARFVTVDLAGRPVLRVDAPADGQPTTSAIGRRLDVPLLSMPYLNWYWYLEPAIFSGGAGDGLDRGLRLTVGFYGGHPMSPQLTDRWFGGSNGMPASDRRFDIVFGGIGQPRGENALQHVSVVNEAGMRREIRPQAEGQHGAWKPEALDIAQLYRQFWPRDRMERVQIAFIGISGLPGRPPASTPPLPLGYIAEVSLTR